MYSPATRLFTVLELLQSRKQLSGSEIARRLEVDTRTVRRYIVMLQDMGIPVEAERGPYGAYQLRRGYKLPPLMYTDAEAVALTLGLIAMREFQFPVDVVAVEGALAKTERVMPEKLLRQVRGLQEGIAFNVSLPKTLPQHHFVTALSTAVHQRQQVFLSYRAFSGDESERAFDPYGIVYNEGYWYTTGYCHLRRDLRTFRLDRIVRLEPREETFERPDDFDALRYVLNSLASFPEAEQVEVLMQTTLERAREVCPDGMATLEETDEGIIFRRPAVQLEWTAYYLLNLDFPVVVRQPDSLREMIRKIGAKALQMVGDEG
jgi:predicted DNA-binding transcriptional regulator YafY